MIKEFLFRVYFFKRKRSNFAFQNILIIYTGKECDQLINAFNSYLFWGLRIFGIVSATPDYKPGDTVLGIPVMATVDTISDTLGTLFH